jgi:carotenoid 1,2-hydratase
MTASWDILGSEARLPVADEERPGSYRWQYFDAISDDGRSALVVIFFVGSVFSPYYAERLAAGEQPSPREHVAVNFALYRRHQRPLWVFSEYGTERWLETGRGQSIGDSHFERSEDGSIALHVDDRRVAFGTRVRADIVFRPLAPPLAARDVHLGGEEHGWRCPMPRARVEARIGDELFSGLGYHDTNFGAQPPAQMLRSWSWGRVHGADSTRVFFDSLTRDGRRSHLVFDTSLGRSAAVLPPAPVRPSLSSWLLPMPRRFDCGADVSGARLHLRAPRPIETSPFYTRFFASFPSRSGELGDVGMAEHLDFACLDRPLVRAMIRLRMARPERGEFGVIP